MRWASSRCNSRKVQNLLFGRFPTPKESNGTKMSQIDLLSGGTGWDLRTMYLEFSHRYQDSLRGFVFFCLAELDMGSRIPFVRRDVWEVGAPPGWIVPRCLVSWVALAVPSPRWISLSFYTLNSMANHSKSTEIKPDREFLGVLNVTPVCKHRFCRPYGCFFFVGKVFFADRVLGRLCASFFGTRSLDNSCGHVFCFCRPFFGTHL